MSRHYSDASRENEKYSLPDVETFQAAVIECIECGREYPDFEDNVCEECGIGKDEPAGKLVPVEPFRDAWWYWFCFQGCMPEGTARVPYATEEEALTAARADAGFCPHGIPEDKRCNECPAPELWAIKADDGRFLATATLAPSLKYKACVPVWGTEDAAWREIYSTSNNVGLKPYRLTDDEARAWGHDDDTHKYCTDDYVCRDCGRPCKHPKDSEGFHADDDESEA